MARVTAEDCLEKIPNRFVLSNIAAKRTKQILSGASTELTDVDNKPAVVALREIADGLVRAATEEEVAALEEAMEETKEEFSAQPATTIFADDNESDEEGSEDKDDQAAAS